MSASVTFPEGAIVRFRIKPDFGACVKFGGPGYHYEFCRENEPLQVAASEWPRLADSGMFEILGDEPKSALDGAEV